MIISINKNVLGLLTLLFTISSLSIVFATELLAKGHESVMDLKNAGETFIKNSKSVLPNNHREKNIILFIGDGMGLSTVTASRILVTQMDGLKGEENRLSFENFPQLALSEICSYDQQTSDSAQTMTAIITGYKARDGQLSVNHTTVRGECDENLINKNI
jgi:alkaline phosphatase